MGEKGSARLVLQPSHSALQAHCRSRPLDGVKRQIESGGSERVQPMRYNLFLDLTVAAVHICRDMTATLVLLFSFSSIYPLSPLSQSMPLN